MPRSVLETELQVASSFTSVPIGPSLRNALAKGALPPGVGFVQYAQMNLYMLTADPAAIAGTLVLLRVEDWLRDALKSQPASASVSQQEIRETLRSRTDEFVKQIMALSLRGKPVWFLACPSNGWIAERHRLHTLFQIYTNLLTTRLRSISRITVLQWPAAALPGEVADRSADRLGQIPFTQEVFDKLGMLVGEQIARTWKRDGQASLPQGNGDAALREYLKDLRVQISLAPALPEGRVHVDRLLRTVAGFSLTGEQRDLTDEQIDDLFATRECLLVKVVDRLADYGVTGVVAYRVANNEMTVDSMAVSCAVLGKQVECGLVSGLSRIAASLGCARLAFEYKAAGRNQMTLKFLESIAVEEQPMRFVLALAEVEDRIKKTAAAPEAWTLELDTTVPEQKGVAEACCVLPEGKACLSS